MADRVSGTTPARSYWIISSLAVAWNAMGMATFLASVMTSEAALAALPEDERALYAAIPAWVTSAYAIAVFGGTAASVGLLMRKAWSVPVFAVSLAAILVQMGHALFATRLIEVQGTGAAVLPLLIVVVGVYLLVFARSARARGWIG